MIDSLEKAVEKLSHYFSLYNTLNKGTFIANLKSLESYKNANELFKNISAPQCEYLEQIECFVEFAESNLAILAADTEKLDFLANFFTYIEKMLSKKLPVLAENPTALYGALTEQIFIRKRKKWKPLKKTLSNEAIFHIIYDQKSHIFIGPFHYHGHVDFIEADDLFDTQSMAFQKEEIHIALFPLSKKYQVRFKITNISDNGYRCHFLSESVHEEAIKQEIDDCIEFIKTKKIDIACFPELSVCDNGLKYITEEIKKLHLPFFILIAGSFHRPYDGKHRNEMPVRIFQDGEMKTFRYFKKDRLTRKTHSHELESFAGLFTNFDQYRDQLSQLTEFVFYEDIEVQHDLLILKTQKYGNFGFAICKDMVPRENALLTPVAEAYAQIADHLFLVSFNENTSANFQETSLPLANAPNRIATFYVNSRVMDPKNNCPTFYTVPSDQDKYLLERLNETDLCLKYSIKLSDLN